MQEKIAIVGAGIGGLTAALACARQGVQVSVFERNAVLSEVGAGIQIGPNASRILNDLGLQPALTALGFAPQKLEVRNASDGRLLGILPLGERALRLYGAPHLCIARQDLHSLLSQAVEHNGSIELFKGTVIESITQDTQAVQFTTDTGVARRVPVLVGADGLWSQVHDHVWHDAFPRATGHMAYRAMLPQVNLPETLRSNVITVWLGPQFHVVQYPVHSGDWLNVVAIVQGTAKPDAPIDENQWDRQAVAPEVVSHFAGAATALRDLMGAIPRWNQWALFEREPLKSAQQMGVGRIALLGDAAHPMRPYLAQGSGMAIEDSASLAKAMVAEGLSADQAVANFANNRWRRNARVQRRSVRNGDLFHAQGWRARLRNAGMKIGGWRVMDLPWLYKHKV